MLISFGSTVRNWNCDNPTGWVCSGVHSRQLALAGNFGTGSCSIIHPSLKDAKTSRTDSNWVNKSWPAEMERGGEREEKQRQPSSVAPHETIYATENYFSILGLPFQARLCLLHGPYLSAFLLEIGNIVPFNISNLVPWFWVQ